MKFLKAALLSVGLGVLSLTTQTTQAASVFLTGGSSVYTTTFNGTGPGASFTADVDAKFYTSSDTGYSTYATMLGSGFVAGDIIYAYIIHDLAQTPINDYLAHFSVKSGSAIDVVGYDTTAGGAAPTSSFNFGDSAQFNFGVNSLVAGGSSTVLLFATSGPPAWQNGTLADGASKTDLVVSASGPQGAGTPLPMPAAAGAGMGLFGLLAVGRRKK
jgi:hypothetical protein